MKFVLFLVVFMACCGEVRVAKIRTPLPLDADRSASVENQPTTTTDAQCMDLMNSSDRAQLVGRFFAGVGGVGALAAAPDDLPAAGRWGIAAGASGLVAIGMAASWYGDIKGAEFERYCEVK